jgi:glycosyltransferase involved in cell wall biosynthesis
MTGDPLVSIRCLVYNHEPYLRQCLDGFVMQQTTFPFEAIVHDDASTDGSAAIIREYAEKYPDIIKPIYEIENQWGKGTIKKNMDAVMSPNSKYIATCEGDDYWTDPHKLQIQVDFLESHPDYFMSCHAYRFYYEDTKVFKPHRFVTGVPLSVFNGRKYCTPSIEKFFCLPEWFTQVLTIVRRRIDYLDPEKMKQYTGYYDYITCYYMLKAGKCALFETVMGVYRKQYQGIYSGCDEMKWNQKVLTDYYRLYQLENETLVLPLIDHFFTKLLVYNFKNKNIKKVVSGICSHSRNVSLSSTIRCLVGIIYNFVFSRLSSHHLKTVK